MIFFVLVEKHFVNKRKTFEKKLPVQICLEPNLVLSHCFLFFCFFLVFFARGGGGSGVKKIKVVQNGLKHILHILVLEFLKFNDIF